MAAVAQDVPSPHRSNSSVLNSVTSTSITWQNITYTVNLKGRNKGQQKTILKNVNGALNGGELLAIMGPSGCGKTTLLDFLADRISSGIMSGDVLVNGKPRDRFFKRLSSYVPQEDSLMGVLTVKETLMFAAELTVANKTYAEREALVEATVDDMGLRVCVGARIGDLFFKGISGGQKRRVSMAIELLSGPSVLILDEPTSGLDSASALGVMTQMVALAHSGVLVMSTIHQPSSELYHLFDKLCLMVAGEVVYFGASHDAVPYFASHGHPCPQYTNPADFMLGLVNTDFEGHADVAQLVESYAKGNDLAQLQVVFQNTVPSGVPDDGSGEYQTTFLQQFITLSKRNLINAYRNPGLYWVRLVMYFGLSVMVGTMYWDLGHTHSTMQDRVAMLFYVAAFMVFMSVAVLPFFIEGRHVFLRERANGTFSVVPWVVSHYLCGVPGIAAISLVSSVFCYFPAALHTGRFPYFLLDLFLSLMTAESFMSLMSACVPHYIVGIALGAGVYGMFMLCEGFMVIRSNIPDYWIWGHYIAFHTYSFRGFMYNEFHELEVINSTTFRNGDDLLAYYEMDDASPGTDMLVLYFIGVFFEICFYFVLEIYHTGKR